MLDLEFRYVNGEDAELLFEWQCHPDTRKYFFNATAPTWDEHVKWLNEALKSSSIILLMAENPEEDELGVVRFNCKSAEAEVSIYVVPDQYSKGLGSTMLSRAIAWIRDMHPEIVSVVASIQEQNKASLRVFEKAGFSPFARTYRLDLETDV